MELGFRVSSEEHCSNPRWRRLGGPKRQVADPDAPCAPGRAGFEQVYAHQVGPDQEGFFRFYAREILPRVSAETAHAAGRG